MYTKKEEHKQKFFATDYIKKWRINQFRGVKSIKIYLKGKIKHEKNRWTRIYSKFRRIKKK